MMIIHCLPFLWFPGKTTFAHLNTGSKLIVQLPERTVALNLSLKGLLDFSSKVEMTEEAAAKTHPDSILKETSWNCFVKTCQKLTKSNQAVRGDPSCDINLTVSMVAKARKTDGLWQAVSVMPGLSRPPGQGYASLPPGSVFLHLCIIEPQRSNG